jgi:5-methylcytosine-specific restriction enzyme A
MFDADLKPGDVLTWAEVSRLHRVRNGIYHRNGRVVSLLTDFGRINPCYPDFHGETPDVVHYTGSGRRGDQKLDPANRALLEAIKTGHPVPLFNKLAPNRWQYLGHFEITHSAYVRDVQRERMVWRFTLRRAGSTF